MSDDHTSDEAHDSGGRAHTKLDEPHPAGDGPRSDRDVGGPTSTGEKQDDVVEGGHGDRPAPFEPHE